MKRNAAKLNAVWVGTLFAAAGAVLGNVLTVIQINFNSFIPILFIIISLCCYTILAQTMMSAEREYTIACSLKKPEDSQIKLYDNAYDKVRAKANLCFVGGTILLVFTMLSVANTNQKMTKLNKQADEKTLQTILNAIDETHINTFSPQKPSFPHTRIHKRQSTKNN